MTPTEKGLIVAGIVALYVGGFALGGLIWMLLWNHVVVPLFGVSPIGYWIGVGVALLVSTVGSAFRSGGSRG